MYQKDSMPNLITWPWVIVGIDVRYIMPITFNAFRKSSYIPRYKCTLPVAGAVAGAVAVAVAVADAADIADGLVVIGLCCVAAVEIVANDVLDFVVCCGVNAEVVVVVVAVAVIVVVIAGPSSNDDANDVMETNSTGCGAVTFVVIVSGIIVVVVIVVIVVVIGFAIVVKQGNEGSVPASAAVAGISVITALDL
uniref:Uncharacterized protein n=1 Tax=Glossina austeni TaxID=7395 RepID=A0A1A9VUL6_GLOAU